MEKDALSFTLTANDPLAPILIRLWADLWQHAPKSDPQRIIAAREVATAMEQWRREHA